MSLVDPPFARWLQDEALFTVRSDPALLARWGGTAKLTERVTAIATAAAAAAEADRQLAFFARGPFALDQHRIVGTDWESALGQVVTLSIDELGYDAGVDVFVVDVTVERATGLSEVTVLRPLRGLS